MTTEHERNTVTETQPNYVREALRAQANAQQLINDTQVRTIAEKDQEIARLNALLEEYLLDIATVVDLIDSECTTRQWCSEYDEWRDVIHDRTKHFRLPERLEGVSLTLNVRVSFRAPADQHQRALIAIKEVLQAQADHAELEWLDELEMSVVEPVPEPLDLAPPVVPVEAQRAARPLRPRREREGPGPYIVTPPGMGVPQWADGPL